MTGRTPCHVLLICGTGVLGHTTIHTTAALYHCSVASQFSMLLISAVLNLIIRHIVNKGRTIIIKQKSTRLFVRFYHVGNAEKLTTECCSAYRYKISILYEEFNTHPSTKHNLIEKNTSYARPMSRGRVRNDENEKIIPYSKSL